MSIVWDTRDKELRMGSDAGRICRPLYITEPGTCRLKIRKAHVKLCKDNTWKWSNLISNGFVELLDTDEEETALISMTWKELDDIRELKRNGEQYSTDTYVSTSSLSLTVASLYFLFNYFLCFV